MRATATEFCTVCNGTRGWNGGCRGTHERDEVIAYRLAAIERELGDCEEPNEEQKALIREHAELMTEWWAMPGPISWRAAMASPSRERLITSPGMPHTQKNFGWDAIDNRATKLREAMRFPQRFEKYDWRTRETVCTLDVVAEARKLARAALRFFPELRERASEAIRPYGRFRR